jgi:sulfofructosephosphate aldolase
VSEIAHPARTPLLSELQTATGVYAMLALDQRESLRGMFPREPDGGFASDEALRRFKATAIPILTPHASAVLLDRPMGLPNGRPQGLASTCALIVAVDVLHQKPGEDITNVTFDEQVTPEFLAEVGASAIKLLVLWRRDSGSVERKELVEKALDLARRAGLTSLVEGIVRPAIGSTWSSPEERHEAILDCARELSAFGPDIYKAEVPGYTKGDLSHIAEQSRHMTEIVGGQWVILSNGVERDAFPEALTEARKGGVNGFLAGRAVWADTVSAPDIEAALVESSVPRLERLTDILTAGA